MSIKKSIQDYTMDKSTQNKIIRMLIDLVIKGTEEKKQALKLIEYYEKTKELEEKKLIKNLRVISIKGMVDVFDKNGRRVQSVAVNEERLINESQMVAFRQGNIQSWVSIRYPGGINKSVTVTGSGRCGVEDFYRLKHTL